jgi:hypothetical protein
MTVNVPLKPARLLQKKVRGNFVDYFRFRSEWSAYTWREQYRSKRADLLQRKNFGDLFKIGPEWSAYR